MSKKRTNSQNGKSKKLIQAWIDPEDFNVMEKLADNRVIKPGTYLRQLIHTHVEQHRAEVREQGDK